MIPTVSLIVPVRNEERVIRNCIKSLLNQNYPKNKLEIIVSIDGSTDKTLKICKEYKRKIKIIESKPKGCKAEAVNEVIPIAKGEIIGIYDADCIVDKNCVKNAVKLFSNKDVTAVSGTLKSYNKKESMISRALAIETCMVSFTEYFLQKHGSNSIFFGKNAFIRKKILKKLRGFDTTTFSEDAEITVRLRKHNYKIMFEPSAITWHEEPTTVKSFFKQRLRWARGILRIKKLKHYQSIKEFLFYTLHGVYFYSPPFSSLLIIIFLLGIYFSMPLIFFTPFLIFFLFNMYLFIKSHLFYKEPLTDLLYLPVYFVLSNLQIFILIKALYDEKTKKDVKWHKAERTGRILK